ncbi:MAG: DUF2164 family protein [Patescibacteria group bacterium]
MTKRKPVWDILSDEQRRKYVSDIIDHFATERDQEIGMIAAEQILDFFLELIFKDVYQKGVKDAKKIVEQRLGDLELEMLALSDPA